MNIVYHHRTQGKGVEGIHIRSIVNALRQKGHDVSIVSPPGCDPYRILKPASSSKKHGPLSVISRHFPEILFEVFEILYNFFALVSIHRSAAKVSPDLIYERYFLLSVASLWYAKHLRIPIIYEVNDSSFVPRLRPLVLRGLAHFIERYTLSRATHVFVVSQNFKKRLVDAGIPPEKISVSHNAIDPKLFNPDSTVDLDIGIPRGRVVIGFVGLFVKWVGLDTLINIIADLKEKRPEIHLLLVGNGPEEAHVRERILACGIQEQVTITGRVPHELVPAYIKMMDICVIPNHETYTSPVKLFEYMAMGKAVLVPDFESMREIVKNGETGILFDLQNDGIKRAMDELVKNAKWRNQLGYNARQHILGNYTWDKNALKITTKVHKVINFYMQ